MEGEAAFSLIHDSADSTEDQIILQETDKLDSDWDEAVDVSKYPRILLSEGSQSQTIRSNMYIYGLIISCH